MSPPKEKALLEKNRKFGVELQEFSNLEWRKGNTLKKIPSSYNIFQAFANHAVVETYTLESCRISPKVACS